MRNKNALLFVSLLFIFGLIIPGFSQTDAIGGWTQYRGQIRGGISSEKLTNTKPELIWKHKIGAGFSEIVVSEGSVYTMFCEKIDSLTGFEYLIAYNEKTGEEQWQTKVDSIYIEIDGWGDGPRSTPTIDENYIFSLSGRGKLSARAKKDGKLIWEVDFVNEFKSTRPRWGYSSSPILIDNMLIMEVGGTEGKTFVAFNKNNGKVIWAKGSGQAGYNSPLLTTIDGQSQLIFFNGNTVSSYNALGDTLWTCKTPLGGLIAMPVLVGPNKLFFSSITKGFLIIEVKNNKAIEVLKGMDMKNDFMTCVYYNGYIYGYDIAALRCISAETGEVKWTKRGFGKGSFIIVDDKLVVLSDKGKLAIAKAGPEAYLEFGSIQAIDGSRAWTAPSFSGGKIYVRNLTEIACFKLN